MLGEHFLLYRSATKCCWPLAPGTKRIRHQRVVYESYRYVGKFFSKEKEKVKKEKESPRLAIRG
jgi:hypothetical protein